MSETEDTDMALDETYTEPMYLLGRLWAVCEHWINAVEHRVDISVVNSLATHPMAGWGRLHHAYEDARSRLRPGQRSKSHDQITAITDLLEGPTFPTGPMRMEAQAPLYMGYWHQRYALRQRSPSETPT